MNCSHPEGPFAARLFDPPGSRPYLGGVCAAPGPLPRGRVHVPGPRRVRRAGRISSRVPWPLESEPAVSKRTFQPNTRRRAKTHGFRLRMRTRAGRAILAGRRRKGREELSA